MRPGVGGAADLPGHVSLQLEGPSSQLKGLLHMAAVWGVLWEPWQMVALTGVWHLEARLWHGMWPMARALQMCMAVCGPSACLGDSSHPIQAHSSSPKITSVLDAAPLPKRMVPLP